MIQLEATYLRDHRWAVRPINALGTMGWIVVGAQSIPWTVIYVNARDEREAINKALRRMQHEQP